MTNFQLGQPVASLASSLGWLVDNNIKDCASSSW